MRTDLTRALSLLAIAAAVLLAGGACGGHPCQETDGPDTSATTGSDEGAALEDASTAPENGSTQESAETPQNDGNTGAAGDADVAGDAAQPEGDAKPDVAPSEKPKPPMSMLDVFRGLKVGDWVRTRWTNKEVHTLLVAARSETTVTIEEIVEDRGFRKAWTQVDVALEDGALVALRERLADGTIEEREPTPDAQRGTSDLLAQKFRRDGDDEIEIRRIEVYKEGVAEPEIERGLFLCRRYKITVEEGRWARLWFSKEKLPDYPVKISYPEENLGIQLEAFGRGRASTFNERQ